MPTESQTPTRPPKIRPSAGQAPTARGGCRLREVRSRFETGELNGHAVVARALGELGIRNLFAVSGTPVHETIAACSPAGVRAIGMRHQSSCLLAAIAHAYTSGRLDAAVIASAGPAVTNLVTGMLFARDNCLPAVVFGGRRDPEPGCEGVFQELDAIPVLGPVSKHASAVQSAEELLPAIGRAHALALAGRPGPVYLDLSEGVLEGRIPGNRSLRQSGFSPAPERADEATLVQALALLRVAKRPLIVFGKGLRWNDAFEDLRALVEELGIPFIASPMGRGLISDGHTLNFTAAARQAQAGADVVLLAGARLNWQFRFGMELAPNARLISIDIHPVGSSGSVRPELAITADAGTTLRRLLELARERMPEARATAGRTEWLQHLQRERGAAAEARRRAVEASGDRLDHAGLMDCLGRILPPDTLTVLDGNISMLAAEKFMPCHSPVCRINAGSNGTIGIGVPVAVGAKLACPERPVVAICGDFAFGLCGFDVETAARHRVPIVVVVVDDGGTNAGTVQRANYPPGHELVAGLPRNLRYDRLAESLGAQGEWVDSKALLGPAIERALSSSLPVVVHVRVT